MKTTKQSSNTTATGLPASENKKYQTVKLAVDVHATRYVVARQVDNAAVQPPQRMTPSQFVVFAAKQLALAEEVHSCYEAGPTGFWLHRKLMAVGVKNVVVRPGRLDAYGRRVNNDKTDALALADRLDRFVCGNPKALAVVAVPSEEQEFLRAQSRQRDQFRKLREQVAAMGRGLALLGGPSLKGQWWQPKRWKQLQNELPQEQLLLLRPLRNCALEMHNRLRIAQKDLEKAQEGAPRPLGLGALTMEQIDREIWDWDRFANRKQIGSYTGLTGGVSATGQSHADLSITKAGNKRLRHLLVEAAWRMVRYQPQSPLVQRWKHVLLTRKKSHAGKRKKAIVAIARRLAVDLWRWRTQRTTPDNLNWIMV